jgi:hypothetical protein
MLGRATAFLARWRRSTQLVACSIVLAFLVPACNRGGGTVSSAGTVTLVNRVRATMRGVSCPGCGEKLHESLRQRLDAATISVHPAVDRVDIEFERSASPFSSASFRGTVADVGGEVVSVQIDVCGTIETTEQGSWLTSGSTRLLLEGSGPWVLGTEICMTGDLHDDVSPARFVAGKFRS